MRIRQLFPILLTALAISFVSCKKEGSGAPSVPTNGTATPVGIPTGQAVSKVINADGGTLSSPDNGITVTIPAGAVSSVTTFSVQPITNTAPNGIGNGYKLMPEGTHFNKPVTISFHYTDQMISGTQPELLNIAYQGSDNIWRASPKMTLDKANKIISVASSHFSDWGVFRALHMNYNLQGKSGLDFNEHLPVTVSQITEIAVKDEDSEPGEYELALMDQSSTTSSSKISWSLENTNSGSIQNSSSYTCTYIAPSSMPSPNPVVIDATVTNVQLPSGVVSSLKISTSIPIVQTYFTLEIDNVPVLNAPNPVVNVTDIMLISATDPQNSSNHISLELNGVGTGVYSYSPINSAGTSTSVFGFLNGTNYVSQWVDCRGNEQVSTGTINITKMDAQKGGVVEGEVNGFLLPNASTNFPCAPFATVPVHGTFVARRLN